PNRRVDLLEVDGERATELVDVARRHLRERRVTQLVGGVAEPAPADVRIRVRTSDRRRQRDAEHHGRGGEATDSEARAIVHQVNDRTLRGASWPGSAASTTSSSPIAATYGVSAIVRCVRAALEVVGPDPAMRLR